VPHNKTVAGVPARVVGETGCDRPSSQMDQLLPSQTMDHVVSFDI
jgi:serine O-acetyltransferase